MEDRLSTMRVLAVVGLWVGGGALAGTLCGQNPTAQRPAATETRPASGPTTLTVEARLVNLPAIVRDKNGALIQRLTKADFALEVDGHPQTIRYFDQDANLPLTLGLLVDTSPSQRSALDDERSASTAFLDRMLVNPKDQAFVAQFAREVELLQDLTSSRPKLRAALKELSTPSRATDTDSDDASDQGANQQGAKGGARQHRGAAGTALYDAVFLAADELMAKRSGRKALILLTDGNDRNSRETLAKALETAQRGDTILYAIYFKGETQWPQMRDDDRDRGGYPGGGYPGSGYPGGGYPGGGYPGSGYPGGGYPGSYPGGGRGRDQDRFPQARNDGKKVLERMTHETGGRLFEVGKKQSVEDIYAEIGKELRAQYRLGYTPDAATAADGYHKIDLSLTASDRKKLTVQTRDGYYAAK